MSSTTGDQALKAIALSMIATLSPEARGELLRVLRPSLSAEAMTLTERRVVELGPLAAMLDRRAAELGIEAPTSRGGGPFTPDGPGRWVLEPYPLVRMGDYDRSRPEGALTGAAITEMFGGSWRLACRSVWGLRADGRFAGLGQPWQNELRGRPRVRYTDDECLAAIRRCAQRFGRVPSVTLYSNWARLQKAHARRTGSPLPRLPDYETFRQRYGGWPRALAKAAPLFGVAPSLPVRTKASAPMVLALAVLDGARLRTIRKDRGIADAALREAAGCPLSVWRALLAGRIPADAAVLQALCRTLNVAAIEITTPAP